MSATKNVQLNVLRMLGMATSISTSPYTLILVPEALLTLTSVSLILYSGTHLNGKTEIDAPVSTRNENLALPILALINNGNSTVTPATGTNCLSSFPDDLPGKMNAKRS